MHLVSIKSALTYHQAVSSGCIIRASISSFHGPVARYFHPPSAKMTAMLPPSIRSAMRWAQCSTAPEETPAKMPSFCRRERAHSKAVALSTRNLPSSLSRSSSGGM